MNINLKKIKITKKFIILLVVFVILSIGYHALDFLLPENRIEINSVKDLENIIVDDDYYEKDMKIELVSAYSFDSNDNYLEGDQFIKGYYKRNTMFVVNVPDPKGLENKIQSIALRKGNLNIAAKYVGYKYKDGVILFITADNNISDFDNYDIEFKLKNKENKEFSFRKKYEIKKDVDLATSDTLKAGEIIKYDKDGYILSLSKVVDTSGVKYQDRIKFEINTKVFTFGSSNNLDLNKFKIVDRKGNDISKRYNLKVNFEKSKLQDVRNKTLKFTLTSKDTSKEAINYLTEIVNTGEIKYN